MAGDLGKLPGFVQDLARDVAGDISRFDPAVVVEQTVAAGDLNGAGTDAGRRVRTGYQAVWFGPFPVQ